MYAAKATSSAAPRSTSRDSTAACDNRAALALELRARRRARRDRRPLPAHRLARRPGRSGLRGPRPLAASGTRAAAARRVHRHRRGQRSDDRLGRYVLDQAFRSAQTWQDALPEAADIGIWVNLAPSELANGRLVEELALGLTRTGLDARRLTLEITESSMSRDEPGAAESVAAASRARRAGVDRRLRDRLLVAQPARRAADRHRSRFPRRSSTSSPSTAPTPTSSTQSSGSPAHSA